MLAWVEHGYQMEWGPEGPAPSSSAPNQPSALAHAGFVDEQVSEMLAAGAIAWEAVQPWVVSPIAQCGAESQRQVPIDPGSTAGE